jgi:carbamoyltransferase
MMGLAPYGEPRYADRIRQHLVDVKADGSFRLNMRYFDFATGLRMTSRHFHELFGGPPRAPESPLDQRIADLARSVQVVTEDIMLAMARALHAETGEPYLCLAGGVALNCVANARVLREGPFADVWIQPAAGDAGGALGAALFAWYSSAGVARTASVDAMRGAYVGPGFSDAQVQQYLRDEGLPFEALQETSLIERVADLLAGGAVVGWFQGRMEFGPRALGNRSFLGDPRDARMQRTLNLKIKSRESFRPFAPSVIASESSRYFEFDRSSPYMLFVAPVRDRRPASGSVQGGFLERLAAPRSALPAVTHVDCSARLHTVERDANPRFHLLLQAFGRRSGVPILINTSFNVRGEPIVCSPEDACRCFLATGADYLAIGSCLLDQKAMPVQHRLRTHATYEPD